MSYVIAKTTRRTKVFLLLFVTLVFLAIWVPLAVYGYAPILMPLRYLAYSVVAVVLLAMGNFGRDAKKVALMSWPMLLFSTVLVYWAISTSWSDDKIFSAQRSLLLLTGVGAIMCAVWNVGNRLVSISLLSSLLFFVVLGALAALVVPEIGVEHSYLHEGKWKGISTQKNIFGMISSVSFILLLGPKASLPRFVAGYGWIRLALACLCAVCVWKSGSRGALLTLAVGAAVVVFLLSSKFVQRVIILLLAGVLPTFILLALYSSSASTDAITVFGFDVGATGRFSIWRYALDGWHGSEMFGFGFGGYWTESRVTGFESSYGWVLPNFHSGYLALLIESGLFGVSLFVAFFVVLIKYLVGNLRRIRKVGAWSYASLIVVFLVHNVFENSLMRSTDLFFSIFVISLTCLTVSLSGSVSAVNE